MTFKRARNKEQFELREADIINAAISIYETQGFEGVTFSEISKKTQFTRPTIYSYFKTKEEIMLKLTSIYFERFIAYIEKQVEGQTEINHVYVANALTRSFVEIPEFIQLYTVLFTIIEKNVSLETLTQFKRELAVYQCRWLEIMKKAYPHSSNEACYNFLVFCLSFASGFYPMTKESEIQKEAIKLSGIDYMTPDFEKVFKQTLLIYLEKFS